MEGKAFLQEVAEDLLRRWGSEGLREGVVFFPSMRARQHFVHHIRESATGGICLPGWGDVGGVMERVSGMQRLDTLELLPHLYSLYRSAHSWGEGFVEFYPWGEVLLRDFDQVDKYLVDAGRLFSNLAELRAIDRTFDYLTDEQRALLESAFGTLGNVEEGQESLAGRYRSLWQVLGRIYGGLHAWMAGRRGGYDGFVYRRAAEVLAKDGAALGRKGGVPKRVAFVGFNALNGCELRLFDTAQKHHEALFYWNHTLDLLDAGEEGGLFVRSHLSRYPSALGPWVSGRPRVRLVSTPSSLSQANAIHDELARWNREHGLTSAALVLADDSLLMPALRSLPTDIAQCNVTMGYPLRGTLVYTLLDLLVSMMQTLNGERTGRRSVEALLAHPYTARLSGTDVLEQALAQGGKYEVVWTGEGTSDLEQIARLARDRACVSGLQHALRALGEATLAMSIEGMEEQLTVEHALASMEVLERLRVMLRSGGLEESPKLVRLLLPKVFMQEKSAFIGEPLSGLQLMGFLETRSLDFERIIVASCNEGWLPGVQRSVSFILPSLMRAFGMPTQREREAMYAYYFEMALARAKEVVLLYVDNAGLGEAGEPSRYVLQRKYGPESGDAESASYTFRPMLRQWTWGAVDKVEGIRTRLEAYCDGGSYLSPHALSEYIRCPLAFYFRYVAQIQEPEEESGVEMSALAFGQILHDTLQSLYTPHVGVAWHAGKVREMRGVASDALRQQLQRAVSAQGEVRNGLEATEQIALEVMEGYLERFLRMEEGRAGDVARIEGLEEEIRGTIELADGRVVHLGGKLDRLECNPKGMLRVLDYKTGAYRAGMASLGSVEDLFSGGRGDGSHMLQVLLYSELLLVGRGAQDAVPSLCYLRGVSDGGGEGLPHVLEVVDSYAEIRSAFCDALRGCLSGLLDYREPFARRQDRAHCARCVYARLCGEPV